ncbi:MULTISPECIES: VWA domain-containing protein [unclassified Arcicella]|uniref:VWA domain-containing protein n=1 Tax=unclassified Arcicella TaxID=2644986 RepID=UPI00285965A5|nr:MULTISPECIES: VWA domain-containing protein [unclassified Arcicella]MDR6563647.1 Ca-activated chloride channel family protein [Arcicella sp. BE51]MDR6814215.1 Ca-activated chloride channel family protein [Arcicella sp. BE140]MDR6825546.1 Ca-activated chloride channel family protein [Arcicella sp. BE139]
MQDWFSKYWFLPSTLLGFDWAHPFFLYGLAVIPLLFLLRSWLRGGAIQKLNISFPANDIQSNWISYLRFIPAIFLILSIATMLLALARPQKVISETEEFSEGIDIMLALDISKSMDSKDIPPSRLVVAKKVAKKFIAGRLHDRIGMVIFSGEPYSLCPLTTDYEMLDEYVDEISSQLIQTSGTAIGNALGMCINRLREIESKSKVAILISDGDNTSGNLDPVTSALLAKAFSIRVYTIAVGSNKNETEKVDEGTLREIAKVSEGKFFRAKDAKSLETIFEEINLLEKVEIKQNKMRNVRDFYHAYLRWSIAFLLLSFAFKNTFMGNILED